MLNVLFRARIAVLGLLIAPAAAACVLFPPHNQFWPCVALIAAAAIAFIHLRHAGLALLAAAAPLPGFLIAAAAGFPASPVLSYLPGFACAVFLSEEIARRIAGGIARNIAAQDALRGTGFTGCIGIAAIAIPVAALLPFSRSQEIIPVLLTAIGSGFCAVLVLPLAASLLPFGENFITRANRLREWRERMLEHIAPVTQPRWGMSVAGIAVVFAVLGFFGAQDLHIAIGSRMQSAVALASMPAIFAAGLALTRDWRRALSISLALAIPALIALWALARMHAPLDLQSLLLMVRTLGIAAMAMFFMAVEASRYLEDDAAGLALIRKGAAVICVFIAAIIAIVAPPETAAMIELQTIILLFGCIGAFLFQPAFAAALETLIPRKSTLQARYKVR